MKTISFPGYTGRYQRFEQAIFFAQGLQFFFFRYGCTLLGFLSFGKSIGDLRSYIVSLIQIPMP
jgi:hypothetical protein